MPTKKSIKEFIRFIQRGESSQALSALAAEPELAYATCSSPPKKYDGQSLLHIAMRNGASSIAIALIDAGADVNYIEKSTINSWNSPPLNDAVEVGVWATLEQEDDFIVEFYAAIRHLLKAGADPNLQDSRGVVSHQRFINNARKRVSDVYYKGIYKSKNDKLKHLAILNDLLLEFGAKPHTVDAQGNPTLTSSERNRMGIRVSDTD